MPQPGRYESRFVRAIDPERPRGLWIRQTTHRRPGEPATTAAWCTVFEEGRPWAVKQSGPQPTGAVEPDRVRGSAAAGGRHAAWELTVSGGDAPLRHLPRPWMYRAPLPRTKLESPRPDAVLDGWIELDGRRLEVAGWRGTTGHNWGSEHAARWAWVHGTGFAGTPGAWLDLALARIRVAGVLTPWIANGAVTVGGARIALGGLGRRPRVSAEPGRLEVDVSGASIALTAPAERTVGFEYTDPAGGRHEVLHCGLAELRVRVRDVELRTAHGAGYELGLPDGAAHGIALEPFPDP